MRAALPAAPAAPAAKGRLQAGWMYLILPAVLFCVWLCPIGVPAQDDGNRQDIERMIAKYARSIDAADTTLAAQVWSPSPDVSFIHPLGHEHGFPQVRQNVYVRAMGDMFSERKLTVKDIGIHVYENAAWAEFDWDFAAKLKKDGSSLNTKGRETQIYRKEPGGWRLVHVHYSAMPVSGEGQE
jgi:ketosteroid isomerase-like protein